MKGCKQPTAPTALLAPTAVFPFWSLLFVDVEKLCYFIEIIMLLPIFDDLKEGRTHALKPAHITNNQCCKTVHGHQPM